MKKFFVIAFVYVAVGTALASIWPISFNPGSGTKDLTWLGIIGWPYFLLQKFGIVPRRGNPLLIGGSSVASSGGGGGSSYSGGSSSGGGVHGGGGNSGALGGGGGVP